MTLLRFKPYYNWNTFNTYIGCWIDGDNVYVLNLIITGIPSIRLMERKINFKTCCFKPYYNWNTFNTGRYRTYRSTTIIKF